VIVQAGKTPITPKAARDFYLSTCMAYGAGFGAAYGAGAGLVYFIVGAIFGAPAGAFLGFILGAVNGTIFGITAARLVRSGTSLSEIERTVRLAAPFATIAGSACLLFIYNYFTGEHVNPFKDGFVMNMYIIGAFASWHAGCVAGRKFMQEYE